MTKLFPPLFIWLLFLPLFYSCVTDNDDMPEYSLAVGDTLPQFTVTINDGSIIDQSSLRDKTSLIVFFNTSCQDCRRELPALQSVYDNISPATPFICIAREENDASIEAFWSQAGLSMPYSPQPDRAVYNMFASTGIPRVYIIGPDLRITATFAPESIPDIQTILSFLSTK